MNTIKFEIGKTYTTRSICDSDCIFNGKCIKRTTSTVTFDIEGYGVKTCRIIKDLSEMNGCETVYPLGRYSMAPTFKASKFAA